MPLVNQIIGWDNIDPKTMPAESAIFVVSHSSYWDIFVVWLFSFTPGFRNLYSIAKPQFREWYYWIIRCQMKFIYAGRIEDKGTGMTQIVLDQFQKIKSSSQNPIYLLISPKGTTQKKSWRSGYYYIAKEANLKIYPLIVDYSKRKITIGNPVDPTLTSLEDTTAILQMQLGQSRVINMENAEYIINDPCGCVYESMFPFDMCCVSLLTIIPYFIGLLRQEFYSQAALTSFCIGIAWKYHLDYEGTHSYWPVMYQRVEANIAIITMGNHMGWHIYKNRSLPSIFYMVFVIGIFYYLNAIPRGFNKRRGKYVVYHSFYHILVSIAAFSLL